MATDRISVRLDQETIKYLERVGGGGRGAKSRIARKAIEFSRVLPVSFERFVNIGVQPDKPFGIVPEVHKVEVIKCDADA